MNRTDLIYKVQNSPLFSGELIGVEVQSEDFMTALNAIRFPIRLVNYFDDHFVNYLFELLNISSEEILKGHNLGRKSLIDAKEAILDFLNYDVTKNDLKGTLFVHPKAKFINEAYFSPDRKSVV